MTDDIKLQEENISEKALYKKKHKIVSLDKRKARAGWLFVLPFIIGFVIIYFPIVVDSIKMSFSEMAIENGAVVMKPVFLANYQNALFVNPDFIKTLVAGLQQMVFDIPAIIIFSLFMAVLLNQKMAGRAVFRAIFFMPVILSTGIMESIDANNILQEMMGNAINDGSQNAASGAAGSASATGGGGAGGIVSAEEIEMLFSGMIVGGELIGIVTTWVNNIFNIVNRSGVQMLIFLAGLQSISPAIYESCQIDGATAWETFWKITFPMISPMILVNAVYTVIDSFTTESNAVMSFIRTVNADPLQGGETVGTAMSWMYFLIVIVMVGIIAAICSSFVFYQRRKD